MNKLFQSLMLFIWLLSPSLLVAAQEDDILGEWITEGGGARVEIFKKDHRYYGKIVGLKEPNFLPGEVKGLDGTPRLDSNNQKESLRSRPLLGVELVKNFRFEKGIWTDGQIYNPENGKVYKCKITLTEDGNLHVRGYIGISLIGSTTVWKSKKAYLDKELAFLGLTRCSCK